MKRNLLSVGGLTKEEIIDLFKQADSFRNHKTAQPGATTNLSGLLFFEASTRTRVGFEVASWKLGIKPLMLHELKISEKMGRSESLEDTIRTLNPYVDCYFVRHPKNDVFASVVPYTKHPIINCGNGYDEHPSQALIDAYAIWTKFKRLDDLTITLLGETRYCRSAHSLLLLLSKFSGVTVNDITPSQFKIWPSYVRDFKKHNTYRHFTKPRFNKAQVVYCTGFPPVNPAGRVAQSLINTYILTEQMARQLSEDCIILTPLPRIDEIEDTVDNLPNAYYFQQNELGLYMRMAIVEAFCL